jgi:hypothetical protein
MPPRVEPTQLCTFKANTDSVEVLHGFCYLDHIENITDSESQPPPAIVLQTDTNPGACALLSNSIAEPWQRHSQGCLETKLHINPYNPYATREQYQYFQCGIKKKSMKMYYDNVLKGESTADRFPSFKN